MCGLIVLSLIAIMVGSVLIFIIEYWEFLLVILIVTVVAAIIAIKYGAKDTSAENVTHKPEPKENDGSGAVAAAVLLGMLFDEEGGEKRHNGHCDGDCRNCPPHYGYRYGRWYYGRCHTYGCQLGGNRGDGAMD